MKYDVMLVGSSAGGVDAFRRLFKMLPANFPLPVVVVHHILKASNISHQAVYGSAASVPVIEIEDKMKLERGKIYFSPPDYHTLIERNLIASLDFSEPVNHSRPSIDVTFLSAAEEFESRVIALLLTGANEDGARGLLRLSENKAYTIVQSLADAEVPYMPAASLRILQPNFVGTIEQIGDHLNQLLNTKPELGGVL
ncbi:MAG: chemotaxis protein CheB [Bdellovibrionota bacterium]